MTSVLKNVYIDKLDDIVNKYNYIKSSTYITLVNKFWRKVEENVGTFYKKELQKTNQKEFRFEKVIKRKAEWKAYNSSFNSWIYKEDIV